MEVTHPTQPSLREAVAAFWYTVLCSVGLEDSPGRGDFSAYKFINYFPHCGSVSNYVAWHKIELLQAQLDIVPLMFEMFFH